MKLEVIKDFAKKVLQFESTGHDYFHVKRVNRLALKLYYHDYADLDVEVINVIRAASYLHDTIDDKVVENPNDNLTYIQEELLNQAEANEKEQKQIIEIILNMSFSKNINGRKQLPLAGKYVQDADRLDSLGAIGLARTFACGGSFGNQIYNPYLQLEDITENNYRTRKTTTIHHIFEREFKLLKTMNTKLGKKIAKERLSFMEVFIDKFYKEWEIEDC